MSAEAPINLEQAQLSTARFVLHTDSVGRSSELTINASGYLWIKRRQGDGVISEIPLGRATPKNLEKITTELKILAQILRASD